jgi:hypothetical protein
MTNGVASNRMRTTTMTSRERVLAALNHREPDRTPICEYVLLPPVADHILGRPYAYGEYWNHLVKEQRWERELRERTTNEAGPSGYWNHLAKQQGWDAALRQQAVDVVELARKLGHDMLFVVPNPPPPGRLATSSEDRSVPADPVEEVREFVEAWEADFSPPSDDRFVIYGLVQEEMRRAGVDLPVMAPAYAHGIWTNTALMQTMLLEPPLAHRHFALATRAALTGVDKCVALGADMIAIGGDFAGNRGPFISPKLYREFIVPEIRRLSRRIHAAGRFAVNASDGNLWPVLEDFLLGCEADGYLEVDLRAGMDLGTLKKRFGDRITFFGNMDCANELSFGTTDEVKRLVKECLRKGQGGGGHIFCCNNAITSSVPVANYMAIREAYREFFGL